MEYTRKYSNFFICCWTFACIYGVLHWCANPLLLEWAPNQINSVNQTLKRRNLPYIGWYPINANNIYNYVCLYLIQIIGGISSGLGIICYDTFYVTMLMVICAQFQYINIMLMKIDFDKYYLLRRLYFKTNSLIMKIKYYWKLQRVRSCRRSPEQIKELRGLSYGDY